MTARDTTHTTIVDTLARRFRALCEAVVVALFSLILVVFAISIPSRYLFNHPIIWADEVLVLAMIWCTFLAAAFIIEEREQVVFDLAYERCPPWGRRAMLIIGSALLAGLLIAALPAIIGYTRFLWRERTTVLELRLDLVYACFAVFIAAVAVRRIVFIARLLGGDWRATMAEIEPGHQPGAGTT